MFLIGMVPTIPLIDKNHYFNGSLESIRPCPYKTKKTQSSKFAKLQILVVRQTICMYFHTRTKNKNKTPSCSRNCHHSKFPTIAFTITMDPSDSDESELEDFPLPDAHRQVIPICTIALGVAKCYLDSRRKEGSRNSHAMARASISTIHPDPETLTTPTVDSPVSVKSVLYSGAFVRPLLVTLRLLVGQGTFKSSIWQTAFVTCKHPT
jgi:hypothetical protein